MMRRWIAAGLIVSLMVLSGVSSPAQAADVTIEAGDTQGLIDAINKANQANQPATITLASNATYTATAVDHSPFYLFGKQQDMGTTGPDAFPVVTVNLTINGNGSTITRSGSALFRFFETFQTGTLTLNDLTLSGGDVGDDDGAGGGAIGQIGGTLVLNHCILTGNHAATGGGLQVLGTATLHQTRVEKNSVPDASAGGGIDVDNMTGSGLTLDDSDVDDNQADEGGGLSIEGSATISNSRVENNTAGTEGGGIYLDENGSVTINQGSIISGNHTVNDGSQSASAFGGAGIDSYFGHVTVDSSVIADNVAGFIGGALFDRGGTFAISNTLITRNQARTAAGIFSSNEVSSDVDIQRDGAIAIHNSCLIDNADTDPKYKGLHEGLDNDRTPPTLDASNNWWGDSSGPGKASGGGGGSGKGDGVGGSVTYKPFLSAEPDACTQAEASATPAS